MKHYFTKTQTGLMPADAEAEEWYNKLKAGAVVSGDFKKTQNAKFHRKMFALLKLGFDNWQQPEVKVSICGENVVPNKSFLRFRKDLTILAGFYHVVFRVDGSHRIEANSLSFAKMSAEEREEIFSKFIDVLIVNVYGAEMTDEKIRLMVGDYLHFT
jgi:hypothetical protein